MFVVFSNLGALVGRGDGSAATDLARIVGGHLCNGNNLRRPENPLPLFLPARKLLNCLQIRQLLAYS